MIINKLKIIFLVFIGHYAFCQTPIRQTMIDVNTLAFDPKNVVNIKTGQKLKEKEVFEVIKSNPEFCFAPEIDKRGNILYFKYDPDKTDWYIKRKTVNQQKTGDYFYGFEYKTFGNKRINNEKYLGNDLIIRFEMNPEGPFFKLASFVQLSENIQQAKKKINAIVLFSNQVEKPQLANFAEQFKMFEIVNDGYLFHDKYNIMVYPTTIYIDKNGKIVEIAEGSEALDFSKF
jgi:hypothetical protein